MAAAGICLRHRQLTGPSQRSGAAFRLTVCNRRRRPAADSEEGIGVWEETRDADVRHRDPATAAGVYYRSLRFNSRPATPYVPLRVVRERAIAPR